MNSRQGLRLDELTVGYRDGRRARAVLTGVDVLARPGQFTALIGPNGTGKSTLLRTVAGLQPALAGDTLLDGRSLHQLSSADRARYQAVVLTERVTPGRLSAREMVSLGRHPHTGFLGRLSREDEQLVDTALASVGASALAGRDLSELSDGERQRVMTARALAQQPRLLLMDEPSAFLDAPGRVALMGLVRRIAVNNDVVAVVSTHEIELALQVADRIWLLDRDGTLHDGTPEDLVRSGLLGEVFNSPDLAFDPASGGFVLTGDERGTVRVSGEHGPELDRLLIRCGWQPRQDSPTTIELQPRSRTGWTLLSGGRSRRVDGYEELAQVLSQDTDPRGLTRVGPGQVRIAAEAAAGISPYFATELTGPGTLLSGVGPERMRSWSEQTCRQLDSDELRVGASTWQFSVVARLWSFTIGCWATSGVLPDLVGIGFHEGPTGIRLAPAWTGGYSDETATLTTVAEVMTEQTWAVVEPLHRTLREGVSVAAGLLAGNWAAAAVGAVRAVQRSGVPRDVESLLGELLDHELIRPHLDRYPGGGHRRRSCCLFYRTTRASACGDCPVRVPRPAATAGLT